MQYIEVDEEEQVMESQNTTNEPQLEQETVEEQEMQELEDLLELLPLSEERQGGSMEVEGEQSEHYGSDSDELDLVLQRILEDYDGGGHELDDHMDLS